MDLLRRQEALARERLDPAVHDYFAGGAGDEQTLADNERAWRRWWVRPRGLVDVGAVDTAVEVLGARLRTPVLVAPVAAQALLHRDGERAGARAAGAAGSLFTLSTVRRPTWPKSRPRRTVLCGCRSTWTATASAPCVCWAAPASTASAPWC